MMELIELRIKCFCSRCQNGASLCNYRLQLSCLNRESREVREMSRKLVPRNTLESAEYVKVITTLLNAKDFRDRINGIKQLLADTENNQELVVANIVKVTLYWATASLELLRRQSCSQLSGLLRHLTWYCVPTVAVLRERGNSHLIGEMWGTAFQAFCVRNTRFAGLLNF